MTETFALTLGRVLIAAAWADGELSQDEHIALEDLLFSMPDLDADTWRALRDDLGRPFDPAHRATLLRELVDALQDSESRNRARDAFAALSDRLGDESEEGRALAEALTAVDAIRSSTPASDEKWMGRVRRALGGSLVRHAGRVRASHARESQIEARLSHRIETHWPAGEPTPDPTSLRRLALGAAILAHVVRLDNVVERAERDALIESLTEHWQLSAPTAALVTDLALDESAGGTDLHTLLQSFLGLTGEDERQRFLASVFRVAAGDGRASFDEIEEVRRIGRGLLLSHRHFIAAKLSLPSDLRDT